MTVKYWSCPRNCGGRWEKRYVKCRTPGCDGRRRKTSKPAHAEVLRGDTYPLFVQAAREIHGITDESCCACGKPRTQERHHDRDHDHKTGHRRGLLCGGNRGCNVLLLPYHTAEVARAIAEALPRGSTDAIRWFLLTAYLERVEDYYQC